MDTNTFMEGIPIAVVGYSIVFLVLVLLYLVFFYLSKFLTFQSQRKYKRNKVKATNGAGGECCISGEVSAAISLALHLHFNEMHDEESGKLTVKRISKRYTPWNSKIYNVINRL